MTTDKMIKPKMTIIEMTVGKITIGKMFVEKITRQNDHVLNAFAQNNTKPF